MATGRPYGPGAFQNRQVIARQAANQLRPALVDMVNSELTDGIFRATALGFSRLSDDMTKFLRQFGARVVDPGALLEINDAAAHRGQSAILASYAQRVTAREGPASRHDARYRARANRFGGGALRRALGSEANIEVGARYIRFLNIDLLDDEAAHWYRLNFGVGSRGSRTQAGMYELFIGNESAGSIGFAGTGPSKRPLIMPPGFFINAEGVRVPAGSHPRGSEGFWPRGQSGGVGSRGRAMRPRVTLGIEGRQFLDTGARMLARDLGRRMDEHFREAFASTTGARRIDVDFNIGSPRRVLRTRVRSVSGHAGWGR